MQNYHLLPYELQVSMARPSLGRAIRRTGNLAFFFALEGYESKETKQRGKGVHGGVRHSTWCCVGGVQRGQHTQHFRCENSHFLRHFSVRVCIGGEMVQKCFQAILGVKSFCYPSSGGVRRGAGEGGARATGLWQPARPVSQVPKNAKKKQKLWRNPSI